MPSLVVPEPATLALLRLGLAGLGFSSGRFRGVSERRLMDWLVKLGRDVQIIVNATPRSRKDGRLSIVFA